MQLTTTKEMLKDLLKKSVVEFKFKKTDGSERILKGTLASDIVPVYEKKTERKKRENDNVLAVWDIEKDEFRSFRINSLISYQALEEGYEL